jgi:transcriptional regulator with XRE-family HTH domain
MTGTSLRRLRKSLGLSQVALARLLRVTGTTLARWERDEVPISPPMERLIRLTADLVRKETTT